MYLYFVFFKKDKLSLFGVIVSFAYFNINLWDLYMYIKHDKGSKFTCKNVLMLT